MSTCRNFSDRLLNALRNAVVLCDDLRLWEERNEDLITGLQNAIRVRDEHDENDLHYSIRGRQDHMRAELLDSFEHWRDSVGSLHRDFAEYDRAFLMAQLEIGKACGNLNGVRVGKAVRDSAHEAALACLTSWLRLLEARVFVATVKEARPRTLDELADMVNGNWENKLIEEIVINPSRFGTAAASFQPSFRKTRRALRYEVAQVELFAKPSDTKTPPKEWENSPGFATVAWGGTTFSFTKNQAAAVAILYAAWKKNTPDVMGDTLITEIDSGAASLRDVFKLKGGKTNPAWGTMIVPGETKGTYRIADVPPVSPEQNTE